MVNAVCRSPTGANEVLSLSEEASTNVPLIAVWVRNRSRLSVMWAATAIPDQQASMMTTRLRAVVSRTTSRSSRYGSALTPGSSGLVPVTAR